jgi:multidrug resistance efflux pump
MNSKNGSLRQPLPKRASDMFELILAVYGTLCWLVFKKFKLVPVNDYTVVTAIFIPAVSGIFGMLLLNMYAPVAHDVRYYAPSTPITCLVQGKVIEVPVVPNEPLKAGAVLFRIEDTAYQQRLVQVEAQLSFAQTRLTQTDELAKSGAGSTYDVQQYQAEVSRLTAARDEARFNLECCTVRAPSDGMVTQVLLRPGQLVTPMPFATVMSFIHNERIWVGSFPQQAIEGIDPGDDAEIAITTAPGHVYSAKVVRVLPAMSEGTLTASGQLIRAPYDSRPGRIPVVLELTDTRVGELRLPVGTDATASIFTNHNHILSLVRGIILRIHSWESWFFS